MKIIIYFTLLFSAVLFELAGEVSYQVVFDLTHHHEKDKELMETLKSSSQMVVLKENPPATTTALTRRAEADRENLALALQSLGFYEPDIQVSIDTECSPFLVKFTIDPGPIYLLSHFEIIPENFDCFPYASITLSSIGIRIGHPVRPSSIVTAESLLIGRMALCGYPLAIITNRKVIADMDQKTISVYLHVDSGPPAYFGATQIVGTEKVRDLVILRKIHWLYGEHYNPLAVDRTQEAIEASGLFCSVVVTPAEKVDERGYLPMLIEVTESKHRTVGAGISYNTQLGGGITASWEHRNVRNLGEKMSLKTDLWMIRQRGELLYSQPDFICPGQDLLWIAEAERERTKGFTENFLSFSMLIDRRLNEWTKYSYGITFKELESEDTENSNGTFSLLKVPFHWRWSNADDLLNPTKGAILNYRATPTLEVTQQNFYLIQTLAYSTYYSLIRDGSIVLAAKISLGSISCKPNQTIPAPERFYAGSENTIRGYKYLTVSPLNAKDDPVGGRSLMFYSLEIRTRLTEKFGWVFFYDMGNVYNQVWPGFDRKQLQSGGLGIRYHTPVGPLRLDIAFPFNRRKGIDNRWEFYLSMGQSF
ncbi:MAG: autotransporter assembly complex family protein [Chlamydiales bacterium]